MNYENGYISLSGIDHSTGSSETCHGISTLFYSLEGFLANNEYKIKNHSADLRPGYAFIEFEPLYEDIKAVLMMFYIGIAQIIKVYDGKYARLDANESFIDFIGGE